jgi:hypothetical protein
MWTFAWVVVFVVLFASPFHGQTFDVTESLPNAIANGHVIVGFRSTGASSGDSILMNISKTLAAPSGRLIITILSGLRLTNVSQTGQSMVLARVRGRATAPGSFSPANVIVLTGLEASTYVLSAYCAEFHKDNPAPTSTFTVGLADVKLGCILLTAARNNLALGATQAAVWRYTDNVSSQDVNRKFSINDSDWSAAQSVASSCMPQNEQSSVPMRSITPRTSLPEASSGNASSEAWATALTMSTGHLDLAPNRVRFEAKLNKKGKLVGMYPSFNVPCSEIAEWKADTGNWMNKFPPTSSCYWFHIKLKTGKIKNYPFGCLSESDMKSVLQKISSSCGTND